MVKIFLISLILIIPFFTNGQNIEIPAAYEIIAETEGDLDKDGVAEKVVVYNTADTAEFGKVREIRIFKLSQKKWALWKSSKNVIRGSEEGGMMGDPFEGIEIKNGILLISHFGGSSWKWGKTDKYRFQNGEFQLIGYSSVYGKPCEYWENIDFNISTGKIIFKKEFETCENEDAVISKREEESFYKKGIKLDPNNRNLQEVKIVSPKFKHALYL